MEQLPDPASGGTQMGQVWQPSAPYWGTIVEPTAQFGRLQTGATQASEGGAAQMGHVGQPLLS
jgi:hypothetical protein